MHETRRLENFALELESDVASTRETLLDRIGWLQRDLADAAKRLAAGENVNPLGVCQDNAREVERLCTVLDERTKALRRLQVAIKVLAKTKENES